MVLYCIHVPIIFLEDQIIGTYLHCHYFVFISNFCPYVEQHCVTLPSIKVICILWFLEAICIIQILLQICLIICPSKCCVLRFIKLFFFFPQRLFTVYNVTVNSQVVLVYLDWQSYLKIFVRQCLLQNLLFLHYEWMMMITLKIYLVSLSHFEIGTW